MDAVRASLYAKLHWGGEPGQVRQAMERWTPTIAKSKSDLLKMTDTDRILLEMADAKTTQQQYSVEQPSSLKVTRSSCTCANISLDKTTR
jgi:hypothetical protein